MLEKVTAPAFSEQNQERLSRFIEEHCGVKMPADKRMLLMNRLSRRLRELGLKSYDEYCDFFFARKDRSEVVLLINAITTNKTEFFREMATFTTLAEKLLPERLTERSGDIEIWSAACASGEEPYSIAMLLSSLHPELTYSVLASDISTGALEQAFQGIYRGELLGQIPEKYHSWLRFPRDQARNQFRVAPEIRARVRLCRINLMEAEEYPDRMFDFIFCRNVLIYFENENRQNIIEQLSERIERGGYLIIGNSESLLSMNVPLKYSGPGIYRKL